MTLEALERRVSDRLWVQEVAPSRHVPGLEEDARRGLLRRPRELPPKYFYDDRGARLFERICATPEYYPTRTEEALLRAYARNIISSVAPDHVIELGSGSSRKTRHLLSACAALEHSCVYWPFDVSAGMLVESARELVEDYPWLKVHALVGDYHGGLSGLDLPGRGRRLFVFLGGTIGNFSEDEARLLLQDVRELMRPGDRLLLGADRIKPRPVLEAAYNDSQGITAAFNLNVLQVLNRRLQGDFEPSRFSHRAFYREDAAQIEMHLVADAPQDVHLDTLDETLNLAVGESIRTEISRKFSPEGLGDLMKLGGLRLDRHYEAPEGYYSLILAKPE